MPECKLAVAGGPDIMPVPAAYHHFLMNIVNVSIVHNKIDENVKYIYLQLCGAVV